MRISQRSLLNSFICGTAEEKKKVGLTKRGQRVPEPLKRVSDDQLSTCVLFGSFLFLY